MTLNPDYREFFALLNAHEVRYLVVGGYAVAFHGHPRYTKDIDVWIDAEKENAERLLRALKEFGFGEINLTAEDFLKPDYIVQLGRPPRRIDIMTSLKGTDFAACYASKVVENVDGIPLPVIGLEELRQNKRMVGRNQDLADLDNLQP